MGQSEPVTIRIHEDPGLFRESINFTAAETAFAPRLIEKDYFCTVLLAYLMPARTLLLDPVSGEPILRPVAVRCISRMEAFAEKFRAALSRREVAIRDFYDLDHAVQKLGIQPHEAQLVVLVKQKLAVPGNEPMDVSGPRLAALRQQLEPQLKPVLRNSDFVEFDLDRAFRIVTEMAARLHPLWH